MKKLLFVLICLLPLVANAYGVEIDGIYYNLNVDAETAEVTHNNYVGAVIIPSTITNGGTNYSVTSIGIDAFNGCSNLTSVTIPNSITSIGAGAFWYCTGLTSVNIPNSVTTIGSYAFYHCSGLTSVTIPNSVTSIEDCTFNGCSNLTTISVEEGNHVYDSRSECNAIIESSTNTLVFGCQNTVIPNSVTSIGSSAFRDCRDLTSIKIPNSVTNIDYRAFWGCSGLTSISVEASNCVFDSREGCNAIIETSSNTLVVGCQNTVIPTSIMCIGIYAFFDCTNLSSITIPNSVTSISFYAFNSCDGLTSVTIPNSVTSIERCAFQYCSNLTSITNLATTPQPIDISVFDNTPYGTLHVLPGCGAAYRAADYWKNFTIIEDAVVPTIDLVDGQTFENQADRYFDHITYTRTFNNTNLQSLFIPFEMSYSDWEENFTVYAINNVTEYDSDGDEVLDAMYLYIDKITSGSLLPNHPYLIKAKSTGTKQITVNDAMLYSSTNLESPYCMTMRTKFTFNGIYNRTAIGTANYAFSGGTLKRPNSNSVELGSFRWYMSVENRSSQWNPMVDAPVNVKVMIIGEDEEEETDMAQLMGTDKQPTAYYSASGVRSTTPVRGLNIVKMRDGSIRKTIVK